MATASWPTRRLSTCEEEYVRKKVDLPTERKLIHTVRGIGYEMHPAKAASMAAGAGT
jgi:hypothetical protein